MNIEIPATENLIYAAIIFAIEKHRTAAVVEACLETIGVSLTERHRNVIRSCVLAAPETPRLGSEAIAEIRRTFLGLDEGGCRLAFQRGLNDA